MTVMLLHSQSTTAETTDLLKSLFAALFTKGVLSEELPFFLDVTLRQAAVERELGRRLAPCRSAPCPPCSPGSAAPHKEPQTAPPARHPQPCPCPLNSSHPSEALPAPWCPACAAPGASAMRGRGRRAPSQLPIPGGASEILRPYNSNTEAG